jgi:hypothetical protein
VNGVKKLIVHKETGEILCIADEVRLKNNGYQAGDYIFPFVDELFVIDVPEVPAEVKEYEWCYSSAQGFFKNANFVVVKSPEEQLKEAKQRIETLERIVKRMNDDQLAFMEDVLSMMQ